MLRFALVVVMLLLSVGCAHFDAAGTNQAECALSPLRADPSSATGRGKPATVKVIQYTDDGLYTDRCDLTDALIELQQPKPQMVVLYVHGWKHNGEKDDADLIEFTRLINTLASDDAARGNDRRVVGIYVAWNAKRTNAPVLKEFTFWGRKRAADRLSQSAAITRLLGAIDSISEKRDNPKDSTIYVGHSFGARILYSATAQLLVHRLQLAHPGERGRPFGPVRGTGDLVVLVNPAFEASLYSIFATQQNRWQEPFLPSQLPVLLAISAENDGATKTAFPLGQLAGLEFSRSRRTTLGNYEPYITHQLGPCEADISTACSGTSLENFCADGVCLTRTMDKSLPHNPFIVAKANSTIVDGHGGIWKPQFVQWLASFIGEMDERKMELDRQ
jgi:hypothetical protein